MRIMTRILFLFLMLSGCARATEPAPFILVDQFGYLPELEKRAVIRDPVIGFDADIDFSPGGTYAVIDTATGEAVFSGSPAAWNNGEVDELSGDRVWWFDFSAVTRAGQYVVRDMDRRIDSDPFEISPNVYRDVLRDAFKSFYYQRAGFEKREPYVEAGYADAASHLGPGQDTEAQRYDAVGDLSTARNLRGGWYDAGDYNQYTSWTSNYVSSLLFTYLQNPSIWTDDMGIPESGNGIPDILDEVKWGLDWLERMQNPDGSMLSVLARAEASPPSEATDPSRYGLANTSATVTAAGAFAMAADLFREQPQLASLAPAYSDRALKAWQWADANPNVLFYNNSEEHGTQGLAAGQQEVDLKRLNKKRLTASMQLYGLTRERAYARTAHRLYDEMGGITPESTNGFEGDIGYNLLTYAVSDRLPPRLARQVQADYAGLLEAWNGWPVIRDAAHAYGAHVPDYWWGSNSTVSRSGSRFAQSFQLGRKDAGQAMNAASHYLHYLHGVNPMGLVYLTNMDRLGAERSASTLYHAWFVDGSKDFDSTKTSRFGPAPGLLVGGPNRHYERDACCEDVCGGYGDKVCRRPPIVPPEGQPPAKSYGEFNDGWPLNSWSVTENSLSYQSDYIRLLSLFVR